MINFCSEKDNAKKRLEKTFAKDTSDKGMQSKIYKELLSFNNKKVNNLLKRRVRQPRKEDKHMANKHLNKCSTHHMPSGKYKLRQP